MDDIICSHYVEIGNNVHVCEKRTDNGILTEEVTVVSIQQAQQSLKTLRNFIETTIDMEDGVLSALSNSKDIVEDSNKN